MPYIKVGKENSSDIKIYYEDFGEGEPIVLIHGYPFNGRAWEKQVTSLLDNGYRVITYDRRGFGLSSKPSVGYDWNTFAQDLHTIMTDLSLSNVSLVGHSMGTGEITRYLANYGSKKVSKIVLISPIPPFILKTDDNPNGIGKEVFDGFKKAISQDRYAFISQFLEMFYNLGKNIRGSLLSEEKLNADFNTASSCSPIAFYKCVDTWTDDFRDDLTRMNVPTLIIQGDADQILPLDITGELLSQKVVSKLEIIDGGSHGIPWTHGEEISHKILSFLSVYDEKKEDSFYFS